MIVKTATFNSSGRAGNIAGRLNDDRSEGAIFSSAVSTRLSATVPSPNGISLIVWTTWR